MEETRLTLRLLHDVVARAKRGAALLKTASQVGDATEMKRLQDELAMLHELSDRYCTDLLAHFDRLEQAQRLPK